MKKNVDYCLTHQELESNLYPKAIQNLSFEYVLTGLAKEYSLLHPKIGSQDLQKFNDVNTIGWTYLLVNPFFVAVSNGNSSALFRLFGEFYTFNFGIGSMSLYELINPRIANKQRAFKHLSIKTDDGPISVKFDNINSTDNFDTLLQDLRDTKVEIEKNKTISFAEICIVNEKGTPNSLCEAIDTGIETIKEQYESILQGNTETILFKSRYYPTFRKYLSDQSFNKLTYDEVLKAPKPFPLEGHRYRPRRGEPIVI